MNTKRFPRNRTPMSVECVPLVDRHGRDMLVVVAKLSFSVSHLGLVTLAVPQERVRVTDVPTSASRWSSLKYPSDVVDEKPGTDVLLLGTAQPPKERSVTALDVRLRVGSGDGALEKVVRVHGPRVWQSSPRGIVPGPAGPVEPTPLVYERTFGGVDDSDPADLLIDLRNPAGSGVMRDRQKLVGRAVPELEDPRAPLDSADPAPAAFGPIPSHWAPRAARAGTYDERWREERAPVRPLDFDPMHASCAHSELASKEPLRGDEPIEIVNVTPEGLWRFTLPLYVPRFESVTGGVVADLPTHLDTLLIDADALTVELCWRAAAPLPQKSEILEAIHISSDDRLPGSVLDPARRRRQSARTTSRGSTG